MTDDAAGERMRAAEKMMADLCPDDERRAELERRVAERLAAVWRATPCITPTMGEHIDSTWLAVAREALRLADAAVMAEREEWLLGVDSVCSLVEELGAKANDVYARHETIVDLTALLSTALKED